MSASDSEAEKKPVTLEELHKAADLMRQLPLRERVTVPNPNGGFRTEVREIPTSRVIASSHNRAKFVP
jgi:hypothetical protein